MSRRIRKLVSDRSLVPVLSGALARERDPVARRAIEDVVAILEGRHPPTPLEPFMEEPDP